jgi:hypothetical protein
VVSAVINSLFARKCWKGKVSMSYRVVPLRSTEKGRWFARGDERMKVSRQRVKGPRMCVLNACLTHELQPQRENVFAI